VASRAAAIALDGSRGARRDHRADTGRVGGNDDAIRALGGQATILPWIAWRAGRSTRSAQRCSNAFRPVDVVFSFGAQRGRDGAVNPVST